MVLAFRSIEVAVGDAECELPPDGFLLQERRLRRKWVGHASTYKLRSVVPLLGFGQAILSFRAPDAAIGDVGRQFLGAHQVFQVAPCGGAA